MGWVGRSALVAVAAAIAALAPWECLAPFFAPDYSGLAMAPIDKSEFAGATACLLGASGEVGKELLKHLLQHKIFRGVVLIGRRELDLGSDPLYKDVIQRVVDFDKIGEHGEAFAGCDVAFCSLGTTRGKSGKDGFYKVDHDYVVGAGKIAKEVGVRHFSLVSSKGADPNSYFFYLKTKGEVEEEIKGLGFPRASIYRPSFLLCERPERRLGERLMIGLMRPVAAIAPTWQTGGLNGEVEEEIKGMGFPRASIYRPSFLLCERPERRIGERLMIGLMRPVAAIAPTWQTVPTEMVAKAMIYNLWNEGTSETFENPAIHELAHQFSAEFGQK